MLDANVVEGVHRITDSYTNWYLLEEQGRLTVVDAGVPASWQSLHDALARLGRKPSDIEAVVLTHAHIDHVGFAERARTELDVPLYVHENAPRWPVTRGAMTMSGRARSISPRGSRRCRSWRRS